MSVTPPRPQPCPSESLSSSLESDDDSEKDSLFDEPRHNTTTRVAIRKAPPIPGLFLPPIRLPPELSNATMQHALQKYFPNSHVNQVMLFGRATGGLPTFLTSLLVTLEQLLRPVLPPDTYTLLFPPKSASPRARQAILNYYNPGEGITPHVDLLNRFGDGIMGISLGSGCVMKFSKQVECTTGTEFEDGDRWDLFLPEGSVMVMAGEARYNWKHGIEGRLGDLVENEGDDKSEWIGRRTRLSITFRWLLPGADIVGGPDLKQSTKV